MTGYFASADQIKIAATAAPGPLPRGETAAGDDAMTGEQLLRDGGGFVELTWEEHQRFLDERSAGPEGDQAAMSAPHQFPPANIRVMVPNVDEYWRLAQDIGARIVVPIAGRSYDLRDFTIADPDGFGVRFASVLEAREQPRGA